MEAIKNTKQYVDYQSQKSGGGCGCWAIGCGSIILIMMLMCGGGFYTVFYSSAPLMLIERAIEENEDVEIEGLRGNFMSGFTIEELRFKTEGDEWSNLTNIKFKYKSSFFNSDRIIIEDISVDGGTIYAKFDPNQAEIEMDPTFNSEFKEARDEIESEMGDAFDQIKEVRVDLIRIANLKIINPETEETVTLDEIKYDGFHIENGQLTSLGNLLVESSQMNINTTPSDRYSEYDNAKRFAGKINARMDRRLINDLPIEVDMAVDKKGNVIFHAQFFDGALISESLDEDNNQFTLSEFTPAEYFTSDKAGVMPSNISVQFQSSQGNLPDSVDSSGTFDLGITTFSNLEMAPDSAPGTAAIVATGTVNGQTVTATVNFTHQNSWGKIELTSEGDDSSKDLWANTIFGQNYAELDGPRKRSIDKAIAYNRKPVPPPAPTAPEVEMENATKELEALLPTK